MGKLTGFEPTDSLKAGIGSGEDTSWTKAEIDYLSDFSLKLSQGEPISPIDAGNAGGIFSKGLENPFTRTSAVSWLINPQGAELLKEVLEQTWIPDWDSRFRQQLLELASETDAKDLVFKLGQLLIEDFQEDTPFPTPDPPKGISPVPVRTPAIFFII